MKLPCDDCVWGIIPMIKRELVLRLVKEHGLKRAEVSRCLGITKGSVTQYLQGKRVPGSGKLNQVKEVSSKLNVLARDIAAGGISDDEIVERFCVMCRVAQKKMN